MSSDKIPISVIVPVKNEQANICHCLDRLVDFAEVIVVDSNSSDDTCILAGQYENVTVLNFQWNGKYPKKRNWTLINQPLKYDWILFVDSDEYIEPNLREEIKQAIMTEKFAAYWIPFHNYFMGKKLKHGDETKRLMLFRKGCGQYEQVDEDKWSNLDMEVHERMIVDGEVGFLKNHVEHNDFKSLKHYLARHNEYSSWEVGRYIEVVNDPIKKQALNKRRKIKYFFLNQWYFGLLYFLYSFIIKRGFLDGWTGFVFAVCKMNYYFEIYCKIKEKQLSGK